MIDNTEIGTDESTAEPVDPLDNYHVVAYKYEQIQERMRKERMDDARRDSMRDGN